MYRNNNIRYFGTQTTTQNASNINNNTNTNTNTNSSNNDDLIVFAIVTGNIRDVRLLVNQSNVNNIIDTKNNYTALHHAVKLPGNDIVEYLMSIGADPAIKQNEGKDSVDLAIEANKRFLINKVIEKSSRGIDDALTRLDEAKYNLRNIERKNAELTEENTYLKKINQEHLGRIEELKEENILVKRKYQESEKAFENLLKKNKK